MGRRFYKLIVAAAFALQAICAQVAYAADVCRTSHFEGMLAHKNRALSILSKDTTQDVSEAKVYVEYRDGVLYYQSNFVSQGGDQFGRPFEPTKIKGSPTGNAVFADARIMFANIVYPEPPSPQERAVANKALASSVQFHLDISVFDESGRPRVDLTGVKNVRIVDGSQSRAIDVQPEALTTAKPPPSLIAKLRGCCLYGRPPHASATLLTALANERLQPSDVKFASLFIDSATEAAVSRSQQVRSARLAGDARSVTDLATFSKLMASAKGSTLVLVGHVEGSQYVIRDSGNRERFRIEIAEVRKLARANGVRLIDVGCETTRAITSAALGFGVMTKYNSVDAVHSINRALVQSRNLQDFLVHMTSDGLKVVVEPSFLVQVGEKQASIYSRMRVTARDLWAKVATVTVSNP